MIRSLSGASLLACAFCAGFFLSGLALGGEPASNSAATTVKAVLFPVRESVVSNTVSANVLEYKFKEGETFKKGETLAVLDDRQYRQLKAKADALFAEAKAASAFAEENYKHSKELFEKMAIGKQELEQSLLDRDSAAAKLQFAEASMRLAGIDLESCEIKAPYAGRFARRSVKEHEFVPAGQPVLEILDDSRLLAEMHMPSARRPALKPGDEVELKIDETGSLHKGRIYEIAGRIDFESRTFEVKAMIENPSGKLSAGMSGALVEPGR